MQEIVICLGAGFSQLPYIREIKKRGYYLIIADKNSHSLGFEIADDYILSSTFDDVKTPDLIVTRIGNNCTIAGVIAPCTGPPFRTLQKLRKYYELPCLSDEHLGKLLDKKLLRIELNRLGCSDIKLYNYCDKLMKGFFPIVKKPRFNGMGGKGVEFYTDLQHYLLKHTSTNIDHDFVYERYIPGNEIAIDAIWDGENISFLNLGWSLFDKASGIMIGSTSQSDETLTNIRKSVIDKIENICRYFRFGPEVLNIDLIFNKLKINFIEIEFVPADGIYHSQICFNYDLVKNYNNSCLGLPLDPQPKRNFHNFLFANIYLNDFPDEKNIIIKKISVKPFTIKTKTGSHKINELVSIYSKNLSSLINYMNKHLPQITIQRKCL